MDGRNSFGHVYQAHQAGHRTNFSYCAAYFNQSYQTNLTFAWNGTVTGINKTTVSQITTRGCRVLCGSENHYYPWEQQASTITTWVLPIIGVLLQAPFISNAFWETVFSLARWIGSPICSLSYILWNIKVTGRCAMLLDMAGPYTIKKSSDSWSSDVAAMRDSLYILTLMNQFTMRADVRQKKEAEKLLRIVLFSKDVRLLRSGIEPGGRFAGINAGGSVSYSLTVTPGGSSSHPSPTTAEDDLEPIGYLNSRRQELATEMRAGRKRGVVPVYISTMWFLFSLALSIQSAFGFLGENAQAHDLALGLLLAWLPVLILSSIVDRNLIAVDETKASMNSLVDRVRISLMDDTVRDKFLQTISRDNEIWLDSISRACPSMDNFFVHFAGQGRKRYHYGAAHPILTDIERAYIADEGRDWLCNEEEARNRLVIGDSAGGLDWLDPRELWQVLSATIIVEGAILGAFILSYFTPTIGLGCRSGGYTIFATVAFSLLLVEIVSWWFFDASKAHFNDFRKRTGAFLDTRWKRRFYRRKNQLISHRGATLRWWKLSLIWDFVRCKCPDLVLGWTDDLLRKWHDTPSAKLLDYWFFKPVECVNAIWLIYIVLAQTTGSYNNCECKSSNWAGGGGYVTWDSGAAANFTRPFWIAGTALSSTTMAVSMAYIVVEWCLQSHLSTADVGSAARGLQRTRRFRWITSPYRQLFHYGIEFAYKCRLALSKLCFGHREETVQHPRSSRRSLRWTKEVTCRNPQHDHCSRRQTPGSAATTPAVETYSRAPFLIIRDDHGPLTLDMDPPAHNPSPRSSGDLSDTQSLWPSTRSSEAA